MSLTALGGCGAAWDSRGFSVWHLETLLQGFPSHQGRGRIPDMNVGKEGHPLISAHRASRIQWFLGPTELAEKEEEFLVTKWILMLQPLYQGVFM